MLGYDCCAVAFGGPTPTKSRYARFSPPCAGYFFVPSTPSSGLHRCAGADPRLAIFCCALAHAALSIGVAPASECCNAGQAERKAPTPRGMLRPDPTPGKANAFGYSPSRAASEGMLIAFSKIQPSKGGGKDAAVRRARPHMTTAHIQALHRVRSEDPTAQRSPCPAVHRLNYAPASGILPKWP